MVAYKIGKNATNDRKVLEELTTRGWNIIEIWECGLKKNNIEKTLADLPDQIRAFF